MNYFKIILNNIKTSSFLRYGVKPEPQRDWLIILIGAFLLLVISCAWNTWTFMRIENGETLTNGSQTSTATINVSTFADVDALFAARAAQEAHYQTDYHFVDPSH